MYSLLDRGAQFYTGQVGAGPTGPNWASLGLADNRAGQVCHEQLTTALWVLDLL